MDIKVEAFKNMFFDSSAVMGALEKAAHKNMEKAGALVRRIAVNSIKPAPFGTHAPPGKPPFDHAGFSQAQTNKTLRKAGQKKVSLKGRARGLRYILFGFDIPTWGVVVGAPLDGSTYPGGITVPQLQEFGATVTKRAKKFRTTSSGRVTARHENRHVTVRPHPYMQPALEKAAASGGLVNLWKDSVKAN